MSPCITIPPSSNSSHTAANLGPVCESVGDVEPSKSGRIFHLPSIPRGKVDTRREEQDGAFRNSMSSLGQRRCVMLLRRSAPTASTTELDAADKRGLNISATSGHIHSMFPREHYSVEKDLFVLESSVAHALQRRQRASGTMIERTYRSTPSRNIRLR